MKRAEYISYKSPEMAYIVRGLELTRDLYVASIIIGEPYTGKRTLISQLFPDLTYISAEDEKALLTMIDRENALVITDFEKIKNPNLLNFQNKKIIAIANRSIASRILDEKFAFIYKIPSLKERPQEIKEFINYFLSKAKDDLMIDRDIEIDPNRLDLSKNLLSLKASIYKELLLNSLKSKDIEEALENFFDQSLDGTNGYRENLALFERPLLKSGLKRYGSQLKLAGVLGINRKTLRKKLHEYQLD